MHKKDLEQQRTRLEQSRSKRHKELLQQLMTYEHHIEKALAYIQNNEYAIIKFARGLNEQIQHALAAIKDHDTRKALIFLDYAKQNIARMKKTYEHERKLEAYLLKEGRHTLRTLHKERKAVQKGS